MADDTGQARAAEDYERLCREKAVAELALADAVATGSERVQSVGDAIADVLLVKGEPGPADLDAGRVLAGRDGEAIGKALDALRLPEQRFGVCSRPAALQEALRAHRLALVVEAVDPRVVIALDEAAAADFASAYGTDQLPVGVPTRVRGRVVLALEDFEGALGDERRKRRVWRQLRTLAGVRVPSVGPDASGRP